MSEFTVCDMPRTGDRRAGKSQSKFFAAAFATSAAWAAAHLTANAADAEPAIGTHAQLEDRYPPNAARYSIDKARIGAWGASAGAQLAALAGVACDEKALAPSEASSGGESPCDGADAPFLLVHGVLDKTAR